jgi:hypothetical protein
MHLKPFTQERSLWQNDFIEKTPFGIIPKLDLQAACHYRNDAFHKNLNFINPIQI